jgi:eukaryotic-like serine/threonine-protein kinase
VDASGATAIPGSDGAVYPFFSPDGEWVGFFAGGKLKKLRVAGGGAVEIADAAEPRGGTWTQDDRIVFAPGAFGALSAVSADGGGAQPFSTLDTAQGEVNHRFPHALPDGEIVFSALTDDPNNPTIAIIGADGGAHRRILDHAHAPAFARGYLFFTQPSGLTPLPESWNEGLPLMAVRFSNGRVEGARLPVTGSVASFQPWATADYAVSPSGIVAWTSGVVLPQRQFVWVSASWRIRTNAEPAPLGLPPHQYTDPAISPDGRTLAVVVLDQRQAIELFDLSRGVLDKLTDAITSASGPVWSPDGKSIVTGGVYQNTPGVFRVSINQPGNIERLTRDPVPLRPTAWHGNTVAVEQLTMKARVDVLLLPLGAGGVPQPFVNSRDEETNARFSPDGKWIAYESGTAIYVRSIAGEGRSARVTPERGESPLWSADGKTIYYERASSIMAVSFSDGMLGETKQGATLPARGRLRGLSADGTRFLVMVDQSDATLGPINVSYGLLDQLPSRRRAFR